MTTTHRTIAALAAGGAAAAAIVLVATPGEASTTHDSARTMTLYGTALALPNDGFVDVDHNGQPSGGDVFLDADVLRNAAHQRVGIDRGTCTIIRVSEPFSDASTAENNCVVTVELTDGSLTVQGLEHTSRNSVDCAITGGTGRYAGATGTARVTLHDDGDSSTVTLRLLHR